MRASGNSSTCTNRRVHDEGLAKALHLLASTLPEGLAAGAAHWCMRSDFHSPAPMCLNSAGAYRELNGVDH